MKSDYWFDNFNDHILDAAKKGLGNGPLTLMVTCTKCKALFELGKESATMAIGMNIPFIEYLRFVQSEDCSACGAKGETTNETNSV